MIQGEYNDVMELFKRLFEKKQPPAVPMPIGEESKGLSLLIGAATDKGLVRDHNEDALFALNAVLSQEEDDCRSSGYWVPPCQRDYDPPSPS